MQTARAPELDRWVRVVTSADREKLITAHKDRNFTRRMKRENRQLMKIHYHPETDSVAIHLREGAEGVIGEIMGEDLR